MPPLLIASPVLLDQSFPRDDGQLRQVATALGELLGCLEENRAHLLLTPTLVEVVESFEWTPPRTLLHEIYRALAQLFLQANERVISLDVAHVDNYTAHPVPIGSKLEGLVVFWSDEVGRILSLHDACGVADGFFVGVASEYGFAGEAINQYDNPTRVRTFPLVGLHTIDLLEDAYEWVTPADIHHKNISFADAKRNIQALGATRIDNPPGGSHYKVRFAGRRSWPLDSNVDPIPTRFLRELVDISGFPLEVIKTTLLTGELPSKTLRLARVAHCS